MRYRKTTAIKLLVTSVCLVIGVGLSSILYSCDKERRKENEVRSALDRYHTALRTRNDGELNDILSDKLKIVPKYGNVDLSREDLLVRLSSLGGELETVESRDVRVKIVGNDASLDCIEKMVLNSSEMGLIDHEAYYTYGFRNDGGAWKIVSIQQR